MKLTVSRQVRCSSKKLASLAGLFILASAAFGGTGPASPKPNIIFINVDDLGWADLGCQGSQYYETPNVDRLAREGMRFTDAYAAAAICSPTRAAMLTGRYPARIGLTDWLRAEYQGGKIPTDGKQPAGYDDDPKKSFLTPKSALWLDLDEVTIAEVLKPQGYVTGHIGKWHLGFKEWSPEKQGFDVNIGGGDLGEPPSYFDPFLRPANPKTGEPEWKGIPALPARKEGEYLTDREADEAVTFIRQNQNKPFLLDLWHYAVHMPIQGKPDLVAKYEAKPVTTSQKKPKYAAMVESVDQALGRVLATLDELGLTSRTIVIFSSDNGGLLGPTNNAPLRGGKGMPYEGGIRVPFIVRWPGVVQPGTTSAVPVTSVDLLPTFAEIAGAQLPQDRPIDGESLLPVLTGTGTLKRTAIFWHFPHYRSKDIGPYSIVRAGDWKLIRHYDPKPDELFDLAADPGETTDAGLRRPEKVRELGAQLTHWIEQVGAKLPKSRTQTP